MDDNPSRGESSICLLYMPYWHWGSNWHDIDMVIGIGNWYGEASSSASFVTPQGTCCNNTAKTSFECHWKAQKWQKTCV